MQGLITHVRTRYRYSLIILRAMVISDFTLRYQASLLGYLWTLLKPLAMFTILYIVFVQLLKIGAEVPYNAIYLLFGIVIWSFFADATTQGLNVPRAALRPAAQDQLPALRGHRRRRPPRRSSRSGSA